MVIGSACLLISYPDTYVVSIVFNPKCRVVIEIWRRSPISFEHVSLRCLLFDPHRTTYPSNIKVQLKNEPLKIQSGWLALDLHA
jgi:hypothetical protein